MKETLRGKLLIVFAMLIFGFYGIFVRLLDRPSIVLVFYIFSFTGIILFLFFLIKDRSVFNIGKYFWLIVLLALINVLNNFFLFQAFVLTTISNAVLTHYTAPIFVAVLAPFFLKEKLEKMTIIALLLSLAGLIFLSYKSFFFHSKDFLGIIFGVASGLAYGLVIIMIKYLSKNVSVYSINMHQSLMGALLLAPFVIKANFLFTPNKFFLLILFAVIFGVVATLLHMAGIKRVRAQHAGVLAYTEPFAASFYAALFFSEMPSVNTIIGGILILLSGCLIIRRQK